MPKGDKLTDKQLSELIVDLEWIAEGKWGRGEICSDADVIQIANKQLKALKP
jgi:hypothetical protein